ncbi:MAG: hypothetical protein KJP00_10305 [Bacteroidia bacterium]|nr:hypothetical protein [Bacteroidia bacterium]
MYGWLGSAILFSGYLRLKPVHINGRKYFFLTILLSSFIAIGCNPKSVIKDNTKGNVDTAEYCSVRLNFVDVQYDRPIPFEHVISATLIQFSREPQDPGVEIKRWPGDTAGEYKYVELERTDLKLSEYKDGTILLTPGLYQIDHNSVSGQPPSGYYGKSRMFEIKDCNDIEDVEIVLYPAI